MTTKDCPICKSPMVPHQGGMWCSVYGHHREAETPLRVPAIGQAFDDVRRVVVLFEADGKQYGWEVLPPNHVDWDMVGMRGGSTHAKITVTGEFHRLTRQAEYPEVPELEEGS